MPRQRQFATNAERQAAYRARKVNVTPNVTPTTATSLRVGILSCELPLTWTSISSIAKQIAFDELEVKRLEKLKAEGTWNPSMQERLKEIRKGITDSKRVIAEFVGANVTGTVTPLRTGQRVCFNIQVDGQEKGVTGRIGLPDDESEFWGTKSDRRKRNTNIFFQQEL